MARIAALIALLVLLAGCGGDDANDAAQTTAAAETTSGAIDADDLAGVKSYLTDHTAQLAGSTEDFAALAEEYDTLAKSVDYDYDVCSRSIRGGLAHPCGREEELDRGETVLRAGRGGRGRDAVARRDDVILDGGSRKDEDRRARCSST